MTISSHKIASVLNKKLNLFIHITETERRVIRLILESSNKKHTVHRVSGNNGTTTCLLDTVTTILHEFSQAV
jgi:hypothetical protein